MTLPCAGLHGVEKGGGGALVVVVFILDLLNCLISKITSLLFTSTYKAEL